ncbi:MAG: hypothetical protein DMG62_16175 [Acidobacteria bacterium]|nr:MAG: hypothetical protein DMG63_11480 [Acidobacteriota bacterium]PYY21931.1 MAG: hypothetical protein DMG62_16175 [Acidobacteriota bacterium]
MNAVLSYSISDNCDTQLAPVVSVSSNQFSNGTGDGNTATDCVIQDAHNVLLRSERTGNSSNDRAYILTVTVTDSAGSKTSSSVNVTVPHDAGQ